MYFSSTLSLLKFFSNLSKWIPELATYFRTATVGLYISWLYEKNILYPVYTISNVYTFYFIVHGLLKNHNILRCFYKVLEPFTTGFSLCYPTDFLMALFTLFLATDIDLKKNKHPVVQFSQFSSVIASPFISPFSCETNKYWIFHYLFQVKEK